MFDRFSVFICVVIVILGITSGVQAEQPKKFSTGDLSTDIKPIAAADLPARLRSAVTHHRFTDASNDALLKVALDKGSAFAIKCIFPMTAPNTGPICPKRATPTTPILYSPQTDPKRAFQLGLILVAHGDKKKAAMTNSYLNNRDVRQEVIQ